MHSACKAQVIRRPEGRPAVAGSEGPAHATKQLGGLSALSSREREISELVAGGYTNRQIARMLSLSEKTVETHLTRTFIKLGVSSRAGVAGVVARAQLAD